MRNTAQVMRFERVSPHVRMSNCHGPVIAKAKHNDKLNYDISSLTCTPISQSVGGDPSTQFILDGDWGTVLDAFFFFFFWGVGVF